MPVQQGYEDVLPTLSQGLNAVGKKYMEQHIHEYLKGLIFRCIANNENGISVEKIKEYLNIQEKHYKEFKDCLHEMESDGLIKYDARTGLCKPA